MGRGRLALYAGLLLLGGISIGVTAALIAGPGRRGSATPSALASPVPGWPFHRKVPPIALTDAYGARTSLASLRGKVIVLAPTLTLCHEVCPMTTQAFMRMQSELARAGLGRRVAFVEATVDPWRDSPARLRAYARLTGAHLIQLTGSLRQVRRFWNFFGIGFKRVPQGHPPDVDWLTSRRETFDVAHIDGVFLVDQRGFERIFYPGPADVGGRVEPALQRLLSAGGLRNLAHPLNAWSMPEIMQAVRRLLGSPA